MSIKLNRAKFAQLTLLESSLCKYNNLNNVYIFGSFLKSTDNPNDIDILIIYDELNSNVRNDIFNMRRDVYIITGLVPDIIAMSIIENKEINFLVRLNNNYLKIK